MVNKTVSFRLPDAIIAAIEERARVTGKTKTDLFVEALCQVYAVPQPDSASLTITSVQQQLDGLKDQLEALQQETRSNQSKVHDQTIEVISALRQALPAAQDSPPGLAAAPDDADQGSEAPMSEKMSENRDECLSEVSSDLADIRDDWGQPVPHVSLVDTWPVNSPDQLAAQVKSQMQVFDKVFSAIPELVFICDRLGHYTYVSPFGASVWGIPRNEIIGKPYQDVALPLEFLNVNLSQFEMVLSFGKLSSAEIHVSSTGRTCYYDYTLSPIQDDEGSVIGVVGIVVDITQRKQAERSLQDALERYRTLFEMANDMIIIVDAETHQIIDANLKAARRLRYTRKELCQLTLEEIETPESATFFRSVIIPKLEKVGSAIFADAYRRKNGEVLPVETSVRLIEFGDRLAYHSFSREVSTRSESSSKIR